MCIAGIVLFSFWRERYEWWALLLVAAAFGALAWDTGWWKRHRVACITVAADILLVFAYLWSLDDHVHVMIRATPGGYTAIVGQDVLSIAVPAQAGQIGFFAGTADQFRVEPTGEGFDFADYHQSTDNGTYLLLPDSPQARFGQAIRFAEPQSAWSNVTITKSGGSQRAFSPSDLPTGSGWAANPRGETAGDMGSSTTLPGSFAGTYTVNVDLWRADGSQGFLIGMHDRGNGYAFAVRMDQPDAIWSQLTPGQNPVDLAGTSLHVETLPMIQREVRLLLGNVIAGFVLFALVPLLYLLLAFVLRLVGGSSGDEVESLEQTVSRRRVAVALAGGMGLTAVIGTALVATYLLQRIPHVQDSVAYLFQAKTLALGRLSVPLPHLDSFFTQEFIPHHAGQWFGKYPPGWPVLLTIGVLLNAAWLVNPILTGADIILIFLIGREVYGTPIGMLAALLALCSPFVLFLGGSFMAHTATLFYLAFGIWLLVRWVRRVERGEQTQPDWKLLAPAGFLLGMAFITRQLDAIAIAAPFAVLILSRPVARRWRSLPWIAAGSAVPVICLLLYDWDLTGNPLTSPYSLWWGFDHIGFGPTTGATGFTPAQSFWNASYNLEILQAHLFGWPFFLTLALAAAPFLLGRANRWDAIFGASAIFIIAAYICYWAHGVMFGPRYYFVAVPAFVLLTARGLQELYRWPLRLPLMVARDRLAAMLVPATVLVGLLAYNFTVYLPAQMPVYKGYNFVRADSIQAVQQAGIHNALIFVQSNPPGDWWLYGQVFSSNSPLLDGDIVYARDEGSADSQLMAEYPGRSYYRLDYTKLTRIQG